MSPRSHHRRSYNEIGHAHELTWSCYHRHPFLSKERTCLWLVEAINQARRELEFDVWAYVIMPEHVHLIIRPRHRQYQIAAILQAIKEPCGRQALAWLEQHAPDWLPKVSVQKGGRLRRYFWQTGGGYDRNIVDPETLLRMMDYVHLNPVRRGLAERSADYRWSSARWYDLEQPGDLQIDPIPKEWLPG
ncbi:MAG: REP-associated tyrosine transposase [Planctomycetaceae bacterium]